PFRHSRITAGATFASTSASSRSTLSPAADSSRWITVAFTRPKLRNRFRYVERLFGQQKDHPGELCHGRDELVHDAREKWPERSQHCDVIQLQEHRCHAENSEQEKINRVTRSRCAFWRFHLQIPCGKGLMASSSNPSMERPSGRTELASKRRNRSLSISD